MPDKRIPLRSFGDEGPAEQRTCFRVTQALQSACAFTTDSVDDVVGGLDKLSLDDNAFYVVDAPNGDFMQVGGCKERLTVELRQLVEGGFFHFVAGYEAEPGREAHVPCESGVVTCRESQVMGIEDARLLVRAFCEGTEILPPGYLFEEVSHRFTGSAYAYSDVLGPVAATLGVEQDRFPVIVTHDGEKFMGSCIGLPLTATSTSIAEVLAALRAGLASRPAVFGPWAEGQ